MGLSQSDVKFFKLAVGTANFGKVSDVDIEARCPVCGDSKRSRNKKRLHLYTKNDITQVNCFNGDCPVHNKTVYSFLRDFYPKLLPQYKQENFHSTMNSIKKETSLGSLVKKLEPKKEEVAPVITQDLSPFMTPINEAGINYLEGRGIHYNADAFGAWYFGHQDLKIGETLYKITNSIIVPLYYKDVMYGFYSRSILDKNFVTYMNDTNIGYKIWNWFNVDKTEPVYIFEGIFDAISSGQKNIIALMGAKLPEDRLKELKHPVFCLDNDKTGMMNALSYAKRNYQVYIQPKDLKEKDFNELMLNHPDLVLPNLINSNLHTGISAEVRIKNLL